MCALHPFGLPPKKCLVYCPQPDLLKHKTNKIIKNSKQSKLMKLKKKKLKQSKKEKKTNMLWQVDKMFFINWATSQLAFDLICPT